MDLIDVAKAARDQQGRTEMGAGGDFSRWWIPNFMSRKGKNSRSATGGGGNTNDDVKRRCDIALHILKPSLRLLLEIFTQMEREVEILKLMDDMMQKLIDPQHFDQLSHSKILNNIAKHILEFLCFVDVDYKSCRVSIHFGDMTKSLMDTTSENVVCFLDSVIHILQYVCSDSYIKKKDPKSSWTSMREEISGALDELKFLRNIRWQVWNQIGHFISARNIPAALSFLLCSSFAPLVTSEKQPSGKIFSNFKNCFRLVRENIHDKVSVLYSFDRPHRLPIRDEAGTPSKIIDHEVLEFFDRVIRKLKKQCWSSLMETVIEDLNYLRCNLLDVLQLYSLGGSCVKDMESLCFSASALIVKIAYQTFFSCPNDVDERCTRYWDSHLPLLIEIVDSLKLQAIDFISSYKVYPPSSSSSDPINHVDSVNCLIKNIEELSNNTAAVSLLKPQIDTYYQEIQTLRRFLGSQATNDLMTNGQMGFFTERFNQLICKSSKITDAFLCGEGLIWCQKLGLFVISNEVKATFQKMKRNLKMTQATDIDDISISSISSKNEITRMNSKAAHVKPVGVKEAENVIELLTRGTSNLQIVSIVGMPGLGKTTMANYVYDHQSVNLQFHVCAWCCISQVYNKESLLTDLLSQVVGETNPFLEEVSGDDLAITLYQNLKGRRYLIVIDDIWDIEVWKDLKQVFPDDGKCSRILFTTRHLDVARKANSVPYNLSLLSDKDCCKLLWSKVFDKETCPIPELLITSRRIAKKCKGLPLVVVLYAGILRNTDRRKESWEQVAERERDTILQVGHGNKSDPIQFRNILELSYINLPRELRPCFLYFAVFLKDTSIPVSKLMELWISEGFVHEQNLWGESLKGEAKNYLDELIDRSLVMITVKSSNGGVKACHIHDVLWDFCSEKSREEKLISAESMYGGVIRRQRCSFIYQSLPNRAYKSVVVQGEQLSVMPVNEHLSAGTTLIDRLDFREQVCSEGANPPDATQIRINDGFAFQYKDLKVLDLGKVRIQSSVDTCDIIIIATLVHLRFLAIRPRTNAIPAEISKLLNLETLVLTGVVGFVKLPESLWKLSRLRNVLMDHGFFNVQFCSQDFMDKLSQLYNLKSVSTLLLQPGDVNVENPFLRRLPNLQKLSCRFVYYGDNSTGCCVFPVLNFLNQLESLSMKVFICGMVRYSCTFIFPSNLKKLSLSNSRLPWDAITVIMEQLPNLQVLKLLTNAFKGQQWDMGDGEVLFPKLKFLKLDSLDIQVWNAMDNPFPLLEQLVVLSCSHLEEIPSSFGEIPTLQSIELKWCSSTAMDSVRKILRDQRDLSNDDFKVTLIGS